MWILKKKKEREKIDSKHNLSAVALDVMVQTWKRGILFTLHTLFLHIQHIQLYAFTFKYKYKYFRDKWCLIETLKIGYDEKKWVGWPQINLPSVFLIWPLDFSECLL